MDKHGPPPPGFMPPPPPYDGMHQPRAPAGPQLIIMHNAQFGPEPQSMVCPHCQATISTKVDSTPSTKTHIIALLLCLFGCWPCCPFVYCTNSCMTQKHYCPNCNEYLGMHDN